MVLGSGSNTTSKLDYFLTFLTMFLIQLGFNFNDLLQSLNAWSDTSTLAVVKVFGSSLVTTLIFYGYNKRTEKAST